MELPRNLSEACKCYDFSYIAGWLNGRYNLSVDAGTIATVLNSTFVTERNLMETSIEYARQKASEIKWRFKRYKIIGDVNYPDYWPDDTWKIWLMVQLEKIGHKPQVFYGESGCLRTVYGAKGTATSKIFTTPLYPMPIDATAQRVSGIKKQEKKP